MSTIAERRAKAAAVKAARKGKEGSLEYKRKKRKQKQKTVLTKAHEKNIETLNTTGKLRY